MKDSVKEIIKSVIISILAVIAIILLVIVFSYNKVALGRIVPKPEKYELSEDTKLELESEDEEQTEVILADLVQRIERLENESNTKRSEPTDAEYGANKENNGYVKNGKQPTGNGRPNDAKQS